MSRSDDRPVLVTGATGLQGYAVVQGLRAAAIPVRALVRDLDSPRVAALAALGAEPIVGDMLVVDSLVAGMADVAAVSAITTPFGGGPESEIAQGEGLIVAAARARVPWLILASVASAGQRTGVPHFESKWRIECALRETSLDHTIVAPTHFYENLGDPAQLVESGELALALPPTQPLQQIALADFGALVARVVARRDELLGERIEVAGDAPTPEQMAAALTRAGGRPIIYRPLDNTQVAACSPDIAAMYTFLSNTGYHVDIDGLKARFAELSFTPFDRWLADHLRTAGRATDH